MIDKLTANVDANGLFVTAPQYGSDGGDSLANNASFELAEQFCVLKLHQYPVVFVKEIAGWRTNAQNILQSSRGVWVRNPDKAKWYSNPQTTSRDQLIPTMLALGLNKEYGLLWSTQWRIIVRGFFAPNIYRNGDDGVSLGWKVPDTFLGHMHLFIRAWGWLALPFYPVLFAADIFLVIAAITDAVGSENQDPANCDDRNGINCHIAAIYACPTPLSWLARQIYKWFRPPTNASAIGWAGGTETNHIMGALRLYFWENNPIIAEAYRPIIEKYF